MEILASRMLLRPADYQQSLTFYRDQIGLAIAREYGAGTVFFAGQSLLELAGQLTQPLEVRQAAAGAFAASVARFGTLLTTREINEQYDRYNASEVQDEETQRLLAGILDVMEARAAADQAE